MLFALVKSKRYTLLIRFTVFIATVNPLTTNVPHHIGTSQLIWIANQLTGFFMMWNIGR